MIFNSLSFLIFITIFFTVYIFLKGRTRLYFILFCSYFFYGWWDYRYLSLILISTMIDFVMGRCMDRTDDPTRRRRFLIFSIVANLGILFTFKYFNFFSESFQIILSQLGMKADALTLNVLLPVGISFYTFQSMSYTIDLYNRRIPVETDWLTFATYVAFFPQLVAGPIERAQNLIPQFKTLKGPTSQQIQEGLSLILWGYYLKVFIADNMSRTVEHYFNPDLQLMSVEVLIGTLAFALQIYGDFSGYSKIARGLAKLFGIELSLNFNHPYFARNPSDFWRRWHISLSSWLRDYLYIPLGGNKKGKAGTLQNLMITMILGGLWHGASWVFVLWGLYHGLLLVFYRIFKRRVGQEMRKWSIDIFSIAITFLFVLYGWLIFRSDSLSHFLQLNVQLFTQWGLPANYAWEYLCIHVFWLAAFWINVLIVDGIHERRKTEVSFNFQKTSHYVYVVVMFYLIIFFGGRSEAFIYFQF